MSDDAASSSAVKPEPTAAAAAPEAPAAPVQAAAAPAAAAVDTETYIPKGSVKRVIKIDKDVRMVGQDAVLAISKATVSACLRARACKGHWVGWRQRQQKRRRRRWQWRGIAPCFAGAEIAPTILRGLFGAADRACCLPASPLVCLSVRLPTCSALCGSCPSPPGA